MTRLQKLEAAIQRCVDRKLLRLLNREWWREWFKENKMQTLISDYRPLCPVVLPFEGRQKYMHTFDLAQPVMAEGFEDYIEPVTALCKAAGANVGLAYMTVDEKIVAAGMSQRRPRPHVDGCFRPEKMEWGGGGGGWKHYCNDVGAGQIGRMSVIVAANAVGCRAWRGIFNAMPAKDGDLSHLLPHLRGGEVLRAHVGYLLSPDCVHESMILPTATARTFLRIALPSDFVFKG
jgi:hypothetical protein